MNASGATAPPAGLRARAELEGEYAAAVAERAAFAHDGHRGQRAQAVIDALGWLLGQEPRAPLSGVSASGRVSTMDASREIAYALDVLYGHRLPDHDLRRPYAAGVEHALLWASYATWLPPITGPPR